MLLILHLPFDHVLGSLALVQHRDCPLYLTIITRPAAKAQVQRRQWTVVR